MDPAIKEIPLPKYIAVEGPIGVGKTTLANKIANTFNYDAFLEQPAAVSYTHLTLPTKA